jgi:hypothetical protein
MQRPRRLFVIAVLLSGACGILFAIPIFVPALLCLSFLTSYAASRQPEQPLAARRR